MGQQGHGVVLETIAQKQRDAVRRHYLDDLVHHALGHAVIIRPDDLGYLHLHAVPSTGSGPELEFEGGVPARGTYRVFVEFYRDDRLHVAAFTVQVRR